MPSSRSSLFLALAIVLISIAPSAAHAGTYTVRACWGAEHDGWQRYVRGPAGPVVVEACPGTNPGTSGLGAFAEPVRDGSLYWPRQTSAYGWTFTAPPGTRVVGFSGEVTSKAGPESEHLQGWLAGIWDTGSSNGYPFVYSADRWTPVSITGLSATQIGLGLWCWEVWDCQLPDGSNANHPTEDFRQWATARNITLTIRDDDAPAITIGEAPSGGWRHEGTMPLSFSATDNVGVTVMRVSVDGAEVASAPRSCYGGESNSVARPCGAIAPPLSAVLSSDELGDGLHIIRVRAYDAARNVSERVFGVSIDRNAPG